MDITGSLCRKVVTSFALVALLSSLSIARTVTFSNPTALTTTATFDSTGTWNMSFCSSDGAKSQCAQMVVTVNPAVIMPRLIVGAGSVISGSSVLIPVSLSTGTTGIAGLQFDLPLPVGVSTSTVVEGPASVLAGKTVSTNVVGGALRVLIVGINQNIIGTGPVAMITLRVAEPTSAGTLSLPLTNVAASDINGVNIPMAASGAGSITVTANKAPVVTVGPNQTVTFPGPVTLTATAADDGAPNPPGALLNSWTGQ